MFIIILIVIVALLLGIVVLIQNPKGGGLAAGFQGAAQVSGVQRTTEFLEKATWYLAITLFVLCLISAKFFTSRTSQFEGTISTPTEVTTGGDTEDAQ
ncbi:MAG TPA: preprotein translocase subunit SecG [Flavobacteriales bacterium]